MPLTIVAPADCSRSLATDFRAGHYFGCGDDLHAYRPLKGHLCIRAWRAWFPAVAILSCRTREDNGKGGEQRCS
jgi:hypothetical protein